MFARLILALLLAAFAFPALASSPCHDAPAATMPAMPAMHHGSHTPPAHDDHAIPSHMCIGCIPPASIAARGLAAPLVPAAPPQRIVTAAFDPASGTPPALPPPRFTA